MLRIGVALVAFGTLAGCSNTYFARSETVTESAGDSVESLMAQQIIDPTPRYAFDTNIPTPGVRAAAAGRLYRCGTKDVPDGGAVAKTTSSFGAGGGESTTTVTPTTQPVVNC